MRDKRKERQAEIDREWGTTSTGVQFDFRPHTGEEGAPKKHNKKKLTKVQKKLFKRAALVVCAIAVFAGLSIGLGDALWDRILPPLATPTALTMPTETAAPTPAATAAATEAPLLVDASNRAAATPTLVAQPSGAQAEILVWIPGSGSRYHLTSTCSGMKTAREVTLEEAKAEGFTPCQRCNPPQ